MIQNLEILFIGALKKLTDPIVFEKLNSEVNKNKVLNWERQRVVFK